MKHSVEVKVKFRYGHRLMAPYKGKCNNVHGEGGTAIFKFEAKELNDCGMVVDFGEIKGKIKHWIDENFDHAYICHEKDPIAKVLAAYNMRIYKMDGNPTAERMAEELFWKINSLDIGDVKLISVGVVESFNDSVAYYSK